MPGAERKHPNFSAFPRGSFFRPDVNSRQFRLDLLNRRKRAFEPFRKVFQMPEFGYTEGLR